MHSLNVFDITHRSFSILYLAAPVDQSKAEKASKEGAELARTVKIDSEETHWSPGVQEVTRLRVFTYRMTFRKKL